jgi:D-alanyl-D-alanine carboxypeptidase/D-alanyl-D-alanine-endopeptidase (penicillin-binding protein 4)
VARDPIETQTVRRFVPLTATGLVWVLVGAIAHSFIPATAPVVNGGAAVHVVDAPEQSQDARSEFASVNEVRIRTCALPSSLLDVSRGELTGSVVDPISGDELWAASPDVNIPPASVQKILTATAAWRELGPDFRFVTSVRATDEGEVWLVGGGDPTLTRAPGNNYYDSVASLDDLAGQTVAALASRGAPSPLTLHIDTSRYKGFSSWDESWRRGSTALGYVAPVSSLMVDGDRDTPAMRLAPRSTSPAARAHEWFRQSLTAQGAQSVVVGSDSPAQGEIIAQIESAPLADLLRIMLEDSDNTLAEALAREVALSRETTDFTQALLDAAGVDAGERDGLLLRDGSGLSPLNQINSSLVTTLLTSWTLEPDLAGLVSLLPVAGETGSLQRRFPEGSPARGQVRAKTGSISGVRSLAGVFDSGSEQLIVFSLNIGGAGVSDRDRDSIDALVEAIYGCGQNLAHWEEPDVSTTE